MGDIRSFAVGQLSGRAENNLDFIEEKWISRKLIEMERIEMEGGRGKERASLLDACVLWSGSGEELVCMMAWLQ